MKRTMRNTILILAIPTILLAVVSSPAHSRSRVNVSHLYNLSDFSGTVPYSEAKLSVDREHDEVYVIFQNIIRVYNGSGMEVFRFGDDPAYGSIRDLATDESGDLYLLTYERSSRSEGADLQTYSILHCNYRAEPGERIRVHGLSPEYSRFHPHLVFYRGGRFLLVDRIGMVAAWVDKQGMFLEGFDFSQLLGIPEKDRPDTEMFGFSLDRAGNMLFTVPVLFQAFVVSPDGTSVSSFGNAGSGPGKFGIVGGIVADDHGNLLVSDSLRNVVMVFSREFEFITEFGYYGEKPANLIRPRELAFGASGKLYVTQARKRGVSVFSITSSKPASGGTLYFREGVMGERRSTETKGDV